MAEDRCHLPVLSSLILMAGNFAAGSQSLEGKAVAGAGGGGGPGFTVEGRGANTCNGHTYALNLS